MIFKLECEEHRTKLETAIRFVDSLDVSDEYKSLFLYLKISRGIMKFSEYKDELEFIFQNRCSVIEMACKNKAFGMETIYLFSACPDKKQRVFAYEQILIHGVKNVNINQLLMAKVPPTLFDFI